MILRRFIEHVRDQNWFAQITPVIPDAGWSKATNSFDPGSMGRRGKMKTMPDYSGRSMPDTTSQWIPFPGPMGSPGMTSEVRIP